MSKKLLEKIEQLEKRIAELEGNKAKAVESPFWMPKEEKQGLYYVGTWGDIEWSNYERTSSGDNELITIGNYFETEELAQRHVDKLKLLEEIKQWRGKHDPKSFKLDWNDWKVEKWELYYDHEDCHFRAHPYGSMQTVQAINFSSKVIVHLFIDHFGDRLNLLLERD